MSLCKSLQLFLPVLLFCCSALLLFFCSSVLLFCSSALLLFCFANSRTQIGHRSQRSVMILCMCFDISFESTE